MADLGQTHQTSLYFALVGSLLAPRLERPGVTTPLNGRIAPITLTYAGRRAGRPALVTLDRPPTEATLSGGPAGRLMTNLDGQHPGPGAEQTRHLQSLGAHGCRHLPSNRLSAVTARRAVGAWRLGERAAPAGPPRARPTEISGDYE